MPKNKIPPQMVRASYTNRIKVADNFHGIFKIVRLYGKRFKFGMSTHYWFFVDMITGQNEVRRSKGGGKVEDWEP